ncbi:MAG TPA: thioredoxin family protein [Candidatus Gracilibacteria bacterium]
MAITHSASIPLGTACPDFALPCTAGHTHSLESFSKSPWLVVIFMCNHCPYVIPVLDKLVDLQHEYKEKGVQLVTICSNDAQTYPADSFENMKALAETKAFPFPYLYDESQAIAKAFDATCTPDIFVYDKNRKLAYHGRINDIERGENPATTNDLEEALIQLLEKGTCTGEVRPSVGCNIKWKQ